ncbi:MAG: hypothetical protein HY060_25915, partial [Proteobacteria bacterium]|nr:hypothetical protein [Pseudomonadota bacterium]
MPQARPDLAVIPATVLEAQAVMVRGSGWPDLPLRITLKGKPARIARVVQGHPVPDGVRPSGGAFALRIATYGLKPDRHEVSVAGGDLTRSVGFDVGPRARPSRTDQENDVGLSYWRKLAVFERRFGHIGYVPEGVMAARRRSVDRLRRTFGPTRGRRDPHGRGGGVFFSNPVPGGTNWTPAGPAPLVYGTAGRSPANAGRVISLAVDPGTSSRIYAGTANAGIWLSQDGGATWSARTDDQACLAIGALAIDPNAPNRVFAGTGEYDAEGIDGTTFGAGLLASSDFGDSWTPLAAATFDRAAITRILFDPGDTAQHMFLACDAGVYESTTGGASWTLMRAGAACDLALVAVPSGLQLIAGFHGEGLYRSSHFGATWSPWMPVDDVFGNAFPTAIGRIAIGQSRNHPKALWAAFSMPFGGPLAGLARTINGPGGIWTPVTPPAAPPVIYSTGYNLHVAVHPDTPDIVHLGVNQLFRTLTGDAPWTLADAAPTTPAGLHVDHHALAFDPANPQNIVVGCDGGVFGSLDGGTNWDHRNRGMGTVQLYSVANHPQWRAVMLGGTQDNNGGFATGAPAWQLDLWPSQVWQIPAGDVVVTAIDQHAPATMYYIAYLDLYRSDNGGLAWTQVFTFPNGSEWI